MGKKDNTQGFAFYFGKKYYSFQQDIVFEPKHESDETIEYEIQRIMSEAFELLESGYKDPKTILDLLLADLQDLKDNL